MRLAFLFPLYSLLCIIIKIVQRLVNTWLLANKTEVGRTVALRDYWVNTLPFVCSKPVCFHFMLGIVAFFFSFKLQPNVHGVAKCDVFYVALIELQFFLNFMKKHW